MNQSRLALTILAGFLVLTLIVIIMAIALALGDDNSENGSTGSERDLGQPPVVAALATPLPTEFLQELPAAGRRQIHIVKQGETLYRISLLYGLTVEEVILANDLADPDNLLAGQELVIPLDVDSLSTPNPPSATPASPTLPADTATPTPTLIPTETPLPSPTPQQIVNGLPLEAYLFMPPEVAANAQTIIDNGQALGRNPGAYSKVGDSTIENPHFMARFDEGNFNLGEYGHLQEVIDAYAGSHARQGMTVRRGFHSWTVNDPLWADKSVCQANETPLACEIRVHNPAIMFFRLGSNDRGVPAGFEQNLRQSVEYAIDNGVLPILGTKADRFEGSNINNEMIRQMAADLQLPLWDFDRVAQTLPGRGLQVDGVHLTVYYAHDYTSPTAYQRGHGVHNLTALLVLDALWRELFQAGS